MKLAIATAAALASLAGAGASAQQVHCDDLKALVAAAEADFAPLRGPLIRKETVADLARESGVPPSALAGLDYQRQVFVAGGPRPKGATCDVSVARIKDEESDLAQSAYRCSWQGVPGFAALKKSLSACLPAAEREEDVESVYLAVERVASGEGYRSIVVSAEANTLQDVVLSIEKSVCLNRSEGGCDDADDE